jgi:transcription elongation factor GreA
VTIYFEDDKDDTETFLLGSREIASTTDLTVYSPESALGHSILGARPGDQVSYTAPSGATIAVTVVSFEPFGG